jgi:hypothetical protein
MLYMGFFSFDGFEDKPNHGYFTCVVNADTVDDSLARFQHLLENMKKANDHTLADVANIYLDAVIEVKKMPSEGFLAHMITREGELDNSISVVLPHVDDTCAQAFTMAPEETAATDEEMEPFMSF